MPLVTTIVGFALVVIAFSFWGASESKSLTALIPAIPGLIVFVLGIVSFQQKQRAWAIHVSLVLLVLAMIATVAGLIRDLELAQAAQILVILVCAVYVALGVHSFIHARKQRQAGGGSANESG